MLVLAVAGGLILLLVAGGVGAEVLTRVVLGPAPTALPPPSETGPGDVAGSGRSQLPPVEAGPPAGRVVVSADEARQVVTGYWPVHAQALRDKDLSTLGALTTGAARRWELGVVACGCLDVTELRPAHDTTYFVPRQTSYPAAFVAQVVTDDGDKEGVEVLVFTRSSSTARWLVAEDSAFWPVEGIMAFAARPGPTVAGLSRPVPASLRARADQLASDLASAWQAAKETGRTDAGPALEFAQTPQFQDQIARVAQYRQDTTQRNGLLGHYRYVTSPSDPLVVVPLADGWTLACKPVRETVTYSGGVYQDPGLHNWGLFLAAGTYPSVTQHEAWQTCFQFRRDGATRPSVFFQNHGGGWPIPSGSHGAGATSALGAGPVAVVGRQD
jgi:hypothetical protein